MLTLAQVRLHLQKGLASLDLKVAYWHVPIAPRYRKFLTFQVGAQCFHFIRLPFALSIAPRVFSRLAKVVATELVAKGVDTLMYLDDWLVVSPTQVAAVAEVATMVSTAQEMGFRVNFMIPVRPLDLLRPVPRHLAAALRPWLAGPALG